MRRDLLIAALAFLSLLVFIPIFTYAYFASDLTTKEGIMNKNDTGVLLLDTNNKPFFSFYQATHKTIVSLSQTPKGLQYAIIASEDKDFYTHPGFSIKAIVRSILLDLKSGQTRYGGSTITQQLVKNVLLSSNKSFLRKYQEIILAAEIERRYSKNEILEMYLNSVYFGEGAFGVEEASQRYFGKDVKDITLSQSSLLAAILPSPSFLSPLNGNFQEAKKRQQIVLEKMFKQGYITKEEKYKAESQPLKFNPVEDDINTKAPHFALLVRDELIKQFGEEEISRSGFRVKTTINIDWQEYAEKIVKKDVENLKGNRVSNGAAVVIDPKTGEIKVMVGSKDWYNESFGKFNVALANRQPGSSFKPIVYAKAFEDNKATLATILHDQPTTYTFEGQTYTPKDFDGKFRGNVTVRRALANSLNVPSVELMSKVGVPKVLDMAKKLGITTLKDPSHYGLSLVLGAGEVKLLELTSAYGVFANAGEKNQLVAISQITTKDNKNVYAYKPKPDRVLHPEVAFLISSILSDNKIRSEVFGNALTISRPAAVKTGTTEDFKDAWTIGYTPSLVVGVWVGNNDNTPMDNIAGSLGAAPIWRSLMEQFLQATPIEQFIPPSSVIKTSICTFGSSGPSIASSSAFVEYFIQGTQPQKPCFTPTILPTAASAGPTPTVLPTTENTQTPTQQPSPPNSKEGDKKTRRLLRQFL